MRKERSLCANVALLVNEPIAVQRASPVARPATCPTTVSDAGWSCGKRATDRGLVMRFPHLPDKYAGQQREDKRLQKSNEQFEHADGSCH